MHPLPQRAQKRAPALTVPVKLINEGAWKPSPARDSRKNMAIALAVYKAAKTGKYVRPEEMK